MIVAEAIRTKLTEALKPARLDIVDESHKHAGHAGSRPEGETHFRLIVVAAAFAGKSRVERQRMIHRLLEAELAQRIPALSLATRTPDEANAAATGS